MNKLSTFTLSVSLVLCSISAFASSINSIYAHEKVITPIAAVENVTDAEQNHDRFVCLDGKCPGKTQYDAGYGIMQSEHPRSMEQIHEKFICMDGKCPGDVLNNVGYED